MILSTLLAVSIASATASKDYFPDKEACFLLFNVKSGKYEQVIGEQRCKEQFPACSTFKLPLAVMAFDSGVLKDENEVLKWDGKKDEREAANKDHNAKTWIRDSIVWFSQRLTPKMGKKRTQKYLDDFNYGNKDLSGGLTEAWIRRPTEAKALKISAYEQADFVKKLWAERLPVSKRAMQLTKEIAKIETSPQGFELAGKTGSGCYAEGCKKRLGWFIGHLQKGEQEYVVVANFTDLKENTDIQFPYGGPFARDTVKQILADKGLW